MRRDSILKYLHQITSSAAIRKRHHQTATLSGIEGNFILSNFHNFVNTYKNSHHLAPETEKAFGVFNDSLNEYFDLIENITDEDVENTQIKWYTNAFVGGTDTVRAKSNYYNAPAFSNVAINMNEEEAEEYNTVNGICFAKVN